jgi:fatty acid desaturase
VLRNRADLRTLAYIGVASALPFAQWHAASFQPLLFIASLVMAVAIGVMHHNHQHLPLWRAPVLNGLTDAWFTLFQGHPGFVFRPAHLENHHVHRNGAHDYTRTWRWRDGNSLAGLIAHPAQFVFLIAPVLARHLAQLWRRERARFWLAAGHYALLATVAGTLLAADWAKAVLFVLLPQAAALFFLLVSNYVQNAHVDERSPWNHSRNFVGWVNPLLFNIGYHTAHHQHASAHWSELPRRHASIAHRIDPRLIERSLALYCLRVFVLAAFVPRLRSTPLGAGRAS